MNILLLMMGGKGTRFGADIPKQYIQIREKPIFTYILNRYNEKIQVGEIIVVVHEDWKTYVEKEISKMNMKCECKVVCGGNTRSESVKNGLVEAMKRGSKDDVVLIHDATHPYVDEKGTKQIIEIVEKGYGATLGEFQYDTVYSMDENKVIDKVLPRQNVISGASPEAFPLGIIYDIYSTTPNEKLETMTSAGAIAIAYNIPMKVVEANVLNLKITHQKDMKLFEKLFEYYFVEDSRELNSDELLYHS